MATIETHRGVAHPWLCDANGHLNTRHYLAMFDDALHHFMHACGLPAAGASGSTIADVRVDLGFRSEVSPGALVVIRSGVRRVGCTSVTTFHEMVGFDGANIHATCEIVSVQIDGESRRPLKFNDEFRSRAEALSMTSADASDGAGLQ